MNGLYTRGVVEAMDRIEERAMAHGKSLPASLAFGHIAQACYLHN
jgi:hypothetical protein